MDEAEKARGVRAGTPRRMTEPQDLPQEPSHRSTQKRTINLDEPSAELDLAVAKAAGIDAFVRDGICYQHTGPPKLVEPFRPSHDMTDAWEAAEKITDAIRSRNRLASLTPQSLFTLQHFGHGGWGARIFPQDVVSVYGYGATGPLAICAAILKTPKGKPDADEND